MSSPNEETKDPICGMKVDKATAVQAERDGKIFYFCCGGCRQKFLSNDAPDASDDEAGGCCG